MYKEGNKKYHRDRRRQLVSAQEKNPPYITQGLFTGDEGIIIIVWIVVRKAIETYLE